MTDSKDLKNSQSASYQPSLDKSIFIVVRYLVLECFVRSFQFDS